MITKAQLQAMSDEQVYDLLGDLAGTWIVRKELCESIMPLAFENELNILSPDVFSSEIDDGWNCFNDDGSCDAYDTNPLRAIACCLILVLQEKK